jgi:hypothetical protein
LLISFVIRYSIEVEYNAKQEEDEQHQAKMKEVDQIEKFRNDKDDLGKFFSALHYQY